MDLRQLEVFIEIAASGGFNRAAVRLNIAQSALSRRVMQLEHELGVELLARSGRGVHLTPAGRLLYERSQGLLRQFKQVREEVTEEAQSARGELALGLPPSLSGPISVPLLSELNRQFPKLFVRTWVATSVQLRDMLIHGKVDLAVYGALEPESILRSQLLFRDPMYLVSYVHEPRPVHMSWNQIGALPLVLTSEPNSVRRLTDDAAHRKGVKLNVVMEVNDVPLLIGLVKNGLGHTLLPQSAILEHVRDKSVVASRINGMTYNWIVASSKERPLTAAGMLAIKAMLGLCKSLQDKREF